MSQSLVITVQLHEPRYHGSGDWPPSPARLFQALVSGAARGATMPSDAGAWLAWLEALPPPMIACPHGRPGQSVTAYVPNNDLDARGGDPAAISDIRVGKVVRPWLLENDPEFLYAWHLADGATADVEVANRVVHSLYQFGRGIDMAWARARLEDAASMEELLAQHRGPVYRPSGSGAGVALDCPCVGSFRSLTEAFDAALRRFEVRGRRILFARPPKPLFATATYQAPPRRLVFEIRRTRHGGESARPEPPFARVPMRKAAWLTTTLRDLAVERLSAALPDRRDEIEAALRSRDSKVEADARVRILPLPSIGSEHADRAIRRVLVEVPGRARLRPDDVAWAFSGSVLSERTDEETGEVFQSYLVPARDQQMLRHYGVGTDQAAHCRWRTVTPVALPEHVSRRRVDPGRRAEEAKDGREYARELAAARRALVQAVRHAELGARPVSVNVGREPQTARACLAETFAEGSRFDKKRLWHAEIEFERPVSGPIVLGDGRFSGLGLMAPAEPNVAHERVLALHIRGGLSGAPKPEELAQHLRRAVMARVQERLGARVEVPTFFHGHHADGRPSQGNHSHLSFHADLPRHRLLISRPSDANLRYWRLLKAAVQDLRTLTAGRSGALELVLVNLDVGDDEVAGVSRRWRSVTSYVPCRYPKRRPFEEELKDDVVAELRRRKLPRATIEILSVHHGRGGGLSARLGLEFRSPVGGLLALGRTSHLGGGLFERAGRSGQEDS